MSTIQTLRKPKAERLRDKPAAPKIAEIGEPLTPLETWQSLGRNIAERRKREGLPEEDDLTMDEIVAIIKEARAERYAEEQKQKNTVGR